MSRAELVAFVRLGRPKFLAGGFVMFGLGAAIARATGHALVPGRYALGQAAVTAFQLMTHYANDYYDYDADRANPTPTAWSGGSRVLAAGELPRGVALIAARVLALAGMAIAVVLAVTAPVDVARAAVPLLTAMFALAWSYSAPPARLCARGAGEVATAVVVTGLVPVLGFALFAPAFDGGRVLAIALVPVACLQIAMLLAIELPDAAGDAATGKRTLVVRLGAPAATRLHAALLVVAGGVIAAMRPLGVPREVAIAAAVFYLPIGGWQLVRTHRGYADPARWESLALGSIIALMGTATVELAAFLHA